MNIQPAIPDLANLSDSDLTAAARNGDRQAFGQIVRRYQGMISGLLYAACGDLHRSEDVAQETFIAAWRSLSGLREPGKLGAWLCQIARHRLTDHSRSAAREDARLGRAFAAFPAPTTSPPADQPLLSAEEQQLMWRALADVPEPYRQTLAMYYRQGQSAADVAAALEISEEAVRQRLARGREMLRDQVAQMVERNLTRSAPSPAFAVAVVAALPLALPTAAKAAVASAAAKGAAAKGTGLLAASFCWIGVAMAPIMGVLGGALGTVAGYREARSDRERRFILKNAFWIALIVVISIGANFAIDPLARHLHLHAEGQVLIYTAYWGAYFLFLIAWMFRVTRRHALIRAQDGTPVLPPGAFMPVPFQRYAFFLFAGVTFGALAWMVGMALEANDHLSARIVIGAMIVLTLLSTIAARRKSRQEMARIIRLHTLGLALVTLVMLNWRFYDWLSVTDHTSVAELTRSLPRWVMNLLALVLFAGIEGMMFVSSPRRRTV